jgi:hypothetical protein
MTRARTPRDDVWDELARHFGEPRTKTERTQFGKVINELMECGATVEETREVCIYVLAAFDNPSVFAVTKWFTAAQPGQRPHARVSEQQQALDALRRGSDGG